MKVKMVGLQPGTFQDGDTIESYLDRHCELLEEAVAAEKPYLSVFPETMTGPYFGGVKDEKWFDLAETFADGPTTARMIEEAKKLNTHIVYSIFEKKVEFGQMNYYNSLGLVSPTRGLIGVYRKTHIPWINVDKKMHVFEKYYFKPGSSLPVYKLDNGVTVGLLLCYDRSFPEAWKTLYMQGAEIILVAACTWGFRGPFFINELRTRAFETHTFVIGLNRAGEEQVAGEELVRNHFGKTSIMGPMGDLIAGLEDEPWAYVAAEVDLDEIDAAHTFMPYKRDRRPELYGVLTAQGSFGEKYFPGCDEMM